MSILDGERVGEKCFTAILIPAYKPFLSPHTSRIKVRGVKVTGMQVGLEQKFHKYSVSWSCFSDRETLVTLTGLREKT